MIKTISNSPKLSVIVPVYNLEQYLSKCINSILKQTFSDFEILLINDGSKDKSGEICDSFAQQDKRVKVYHKENGGVSSARNVGLKHAKGEWVTFIDGDDKVLDSYFSIWNNIQCSCDSDMILFSDKRGDSQLVHYSNKEILSKLINFRVMPSLCLGFYKNEIFGKNNLLLDESLHFYEDFEFLFRIMKNGNRATKYNDCFYEYTKREGSANNMQINYKVMSCLNIADKLDFNDTNLTDQDRDNVKMKFMTQVVYYFLKSEKMDENIALQIREYNKRNVKLIINSRTESIKSLLVLFVSALSPKLLYISLSRYYMKHLQKHTV